MAEIIAKLFPFEKLGRRAAVIMPAYLFCLGGLAAVALVVMFAESSNSPGADDPGCDIDEGCEENQLASFGNCLWFVFVTFHTCAYGDLIPTTTMGKSVAMLCSGSGYVFLVTICLAAFISTTQPSGTHPDVLRAAVHKALKQVIPSYLVTIALVLIFFGIFFDAADCVEEYGPDDQIVEDIGDLYLQPRSANHVVAREADQGYSRTRNFRSDVLLMEHVSPREL
jgi:hypothetical protein